MNDQCLIVFCKYPEKGRMKTRLARDTDEEFVLALSRCFIEDIVALSQKVDASVIFAVDGDPRNFTKDPLFNQDNSSLIVQKGKDLGERMFNAMAEAYLRGFHKAVLIGTDCPDLTSELIHNAFGILDVVDIVLGPSTDGGYYLIGSTANSLSREIFHDIPWSTNNVLEKTIKQLNSRCASYSLLQKHRDIDELADLIDFYKRNGESNKKLCTVRFLQHHREALNEKIYL